MQGKRFKLREQAIITKPHEISSVLLRSAASMASGRKKRRTEEENRKFHQDWKESFAFIYNRDGLQTCLICHEKLVHNKKSNLERHFITKHIQFAGKYPTGEERKKAVEELQKNSNSQIPC
ncbi:hypothetical protein AVEN_152568-1 [Araneus ventricosus]|uniref:SPIN-DOC-like zinc-finger domain-containing protein n=1 Tax=Araneus ventricosus TaxID=182803 RepID=A0A4Y2VZK8_ARAVE|nr:hypothetical protein AVEN_2789-1 [Araneus ventricosus]GBO29201.1 hypothetical protein AVEN_64016-1 [Araneus ventricosus]GBO29207.1 hypothetical protein AVEN_152568-1 [Araneus ventricosus]